MNMEEFYNTMKSALEHFGLRFHEMHKVKVIIGMDCISFVYKQHRVTVEHRP